MKRKHYVVVRDFRYARYAMFLEDFCPQACPHQRFSKGENNLSSEFKAKLIG